MSGFSGVSSPERVVGLKPQPNISLPLMCLARSFFEPEQAWKYYEASVAAVRSQGNVNENVVGGHYYVRSGDEELTALFLVATAVVPTLYESNDHIAQVCAHRQQMPFRPAPHDSFIFS